MGLNVTRKVIGAHLLDGEMEPGAEIALKIDQVLIQDLTGTQAVMQFEAMGFDRVKCERAVAYADHNVLHIKPENMEDHIYLSHACRKYGIWFAKPGSGIGHQIHLEHFAVPGKTALGADSHTPHAGGIGMLAVGAGGLDVAIAMAGGPYYLDMPKVVNVRLTGELAPWATAKDVILELLRRVTVRGGKGKVFEFTGPGASTLNGQQRVAITNMSYELGSTTAIFPSDEVTREFMERLGRVDEWTEQLPDADAEYDEVMELDLSEVEPMVALPSLPDKVVPVREAAGTKIEQVMVGSCTNGSYTDLQAVARMMKGQRVHPEVYFFIHPSSRSALELLAQEGMVADLITAGVNVAEPTCGACIGFGHVPAPETRSLRAINRNFKGRSGLAEDQVFLASPETAAATAIKGVITDPRDLGDELGIATPGADLPSKISQDNPMLVAPPAAEEAKGLDVRRGPNIVPPPVKDPLEETVVGSILLKVGDDISTDHIMPAGADIVRYRSNVPKIAEFVYHRVDPDFAKRAKERDGGFILGGANYGQGSSREHAALAPMYLGVRAVLAKSFSRIHFNNLVNWGLLPLEFRDESDYDRIDQDDELEIPDARKQVEQGASELTVRDLTKDFDFVVHLDLNARERQYMLAGGKLGYTMREESA